MIQIPLIAGNQTFMIDLGGKYYCLTLTYRAATYGSWVLDIESADGETKLCGIPLVCGVDMFSQFEYLGLGHLRALVSGSYTKTPGWDDMGSTLELYWEA